MFRIILQQVRTQGGCPGCPGNHLFVLRYLIQYVPIDSFTHHIAMWPFRQYGITVKLLSQRMRAKQGRVFTNFMMVFGITQPGREPTTYCVRGGHANLYGNISHLDAFPLYQHSLIKLQIYIILWLLHLDYLR